MEIDVTLRDGTFRADCMDMPGTPQTGTGRSAAEAVGNLMYHLARVEKSSIQRILGIEITINRKFKRADIINPTGGKE